MLIHVNVKMPLTVATSESLKVCDFFSAFKFYELLKFHAQFLFLPNISIMLVKAENGFIRP